MAARAMLVHSPLTRISGARSFTTWVQNAGQPVEVGVADVVVVVVLESKVLDEIGTELLVEVEVVEVEIELETAVLDDEDVAELLETVELVCDVATEDEIEELDVATVLDVLLVEDEATTPALHEATEVLDPE